MDEGEEEVEGERRRRRRRRRMRRGAGQTDSTRLGPHGPPWAQERRRQRGMGRAWKGETEGEGDLGRRAWVFIRYRTKDEEEWVGEGLFWSPTSSRAPSQG